MLAGEVDDSGDSFALDEAHRRFAVENAETGVDSGFDFHDGRGAEVGLVYSVTIGDALGINGATILKHFHFGSRHGITGDDEPRIWVDGAFVKHFHLQIAVGIFVATGKKRHW